jgi:cytochrome P450
MLAAEGQVHKRQRRVISPSFSIQNLRALMSVGFRKGDELGDKWMEMIIQENGSARIDVCHWISRATFDVIGVAGELFLGLFHSCQF